MFMQRPTRIWTASAVASLLAACGGGGSSEPPPVQQAQPATTIYANSVALGVTTPQSITYQASTGAIQATVTTSTASALLPVGTTLVLAEHMEPDLPGLREICVSGHGDSTNVVSNINLGVVTQSAAILMDAQWTAVDALAAWNAAVLAGSAWSGWENCGAKPEGPPSRSSRLVPTNSGGYTEDVFDGNPGTNFNAVLRNVSASDVTAMLSTQGLLFSDEPQRPLQLKLRAFANPAGRLIFVESGAPAAGAPASARGFVALYVRGG